MWVQILCLGGDSPPSLNYYGLCMTIGEHHKVNKHCTWDCHNQITSRGVGISNRVLLLPELPHDRVSAGDWVWEQRVCSSEYECLEMDYSTQ